MAETFLVVDDSGLARVVVRQALRDLRPDCTILEAATGAEAERVSGFETRTTAFIDFNMPGEDGLELAAHLRPRRADLPIAIVSANAQTDVLERTRALGAVFLEKPVSREALAGFVSAPPAQRRSA